MPNWCHVTLTAKGDEQELARFVAAVKESDDQPLSFEKLVPSAVAGEDWYEWRCANWGCKWDAAFAKGMVMAMVVEGGDVDASKEAQGVTVTPTVAVWKFDTPWSPPVPFVAAASEQFAELEFELQFAEVGHEFAGRMRYVAGVRVEDEVLEVSDVLAPEEMWF